MESDNGDNTVQVSQFCTSFRYLSKIFNREIKKTSGFLIKLYLKIKPENLIYKIIHFIFNIEFNLLL